MGKRSAGVECPICLSHFAKSKVVYHYEKELISMKETIDSAKQPPICPVCSASIPCNSEEGINTHVDLCLQMAACSERRASSSCVNEEAEEEIDITEVDDDGCGPPQFNDASLISVQRLRRNEKSIRELLHGKPFQKRYKLNLISANSDQESTGGENSDDSKNSGQYLAGLNINETTFDTDLACRNNSTIYENINNDSSAGKINTTPRYSVSQNINTDSSIIINSLKATINELHKQHELLDKFKCNICLAQYEAPTTSIKCWHVFCEQCWLASLGSKKVCPQCDKITTPSDLRRIYP